MCKFMLSLCLQKQTRNLNNSFMKIAKRMNLGMDSESTLRKLPSLFNSQSRSFDGLDFIVYKCYNTFDVQGKIWTIT